MLADVKVEPTADEPALSPNWGEDGLSAAERLYAWNTARSAGDVVGQCRQAGQMPFQAERRARCCSFAMSSAPTSTMSCRRWSVTSTAMAFTMIKVKANQEVRCVARRSRQSLDQMGDGLDSEPPPARSPRCCRISAARSPMMCSPEVLGMPTIWVPHSYPGCSQHAPDEHILLSGDRGGAQADGGPVQGSGEMKRPL